MLTTAAHETRLLRGSRVRAAIWRRSVLLATCLVALLSASVAHAQVVVDPRTLEFDPSPDHNATLPDGTFKVQRYDLGFYLIGAAQPFQTSSLGKPMPQPDGKIRLLLTTVTSWPLPNVDYEARVAAVGPTGTGLSAPSNPFRFSSACTYTVSPTSQSFVASGGVGTVSVTTTSGCGWSATTGASWISIANGSGTDTASFTYTVAANSAASLRTGTLTIAGQTLTVTQAGTACTYSISPASQSFAAAGGSGNVALTAGSGCTWTASSAVPWITPGVTSGTGPASVSFTVAANSATSSRTGTLTIAGKTFTVTQAAAACTYSISPTSQSFAAAGGSGSVTVTAGSGCTWTASSGVSWATPGVTSGTGTTTFSFTVAANSATSSRTGTLTIAGKTFTVTQAAAGPVPPGVPTITAFAPAIGSPGTAVAITGTNFDPAAANNQVKFNVRPAVVSSSNTTSIATSVPTQATSGRISVTTGAGTAVSAADFFVPPAPYTAADVVFTGRVATGASQTVTIGTAGKIGLVVFDGTAGRRISLTVSAGPSGTVTILNPDGTTLGSVFVGAVASFIDTKTLATTGVYTIVVDPSTTSTGSVTVSLYDVPADVTNSIVPGGAAVSVTITTPGQNGRLTFNGTAGRRVSLTVSAGPSGTITILNPDGTTLGSVFVGSVATLIDAKTLATTGTYTIVVDPFNMNTGSVTLSLYDIPADVTGSIVPGGVAVTVNITTPGQNGRLTFNGTAGQRVSLKTSAGPTGTVSILNPGGTVLASTFVGATMTFIDTRTLPATGLYAITVDPSSGNTGMVTLTLFDVPADLSGAISIGGPAFSMTIGTPGQNGSLTFGGTAGQQVTVRNTGNTIGTVTVTLLKPDGTALTSSISVLGSFNLASQTLPVTGTYRISIDPLQANSGTLSVSVTSP